MLNALITSIVMTASVASAAPCEQPTQTPVAVSYQQPKSVYHEPAWHHPIKVWKDLSGSLKLDGQHYNYVKVGAQAGTFDTLELRNLGGRTTIKQVTVDFVGGGSQVIKLGQTLDAKNPTLTVDLQGNHRTIQRVVLAGSSSWNGSYDVLAV